MAKIAQSVTPVTVIHLTASAQSRVATLHLIIHELLAFLAVPVAIAMPAPAVADRDLLSLSAKTGILQLRSRPPV